MAVCLKYGENNTKGIKISQLFSKYLWNIAGLINYFESNKQISEALSTSQKHYDQAILQVKNKPINE